MNDAPIELIALVEDEFTRTIAARREGEPSSTHVQDLGDAYLAAQSRGVHLVIPERLAYQLRELGDLPPELPSWIHVRHDE